MREVRADGFTTNDLLQYILDGHQSCVSSKLIHHQRHLRLLAPRLAEHLAKRHALGNDHGLVQNGPQVKRPVERHGPLEAFESLAQQVLGKQNPQDVVRRALVDRNARVLVLHHLVEQKIEIVGERQRGYAGPGHHDLSHQHAVQIKYSLDHFLLLRAQ